MIGQSILHYKILEKLGEGGMGVVYKALDTKLDRLVALKFLPSHLTASEDKKRFIREAKTASALNHPNICTIHDIIENDKQLFIVMEFIEGKTLHNKKEELSLNQIVDIGLQVSEGLVAAHKKGIVHRDIKPENIMIRNDGIAQIMDFGLAKINAANEVSRLTKTGSTIGTVYYMSPEQVMGKEVDGRSDIFSLGVVLYELVAGHTPFKGKYESALLYEIVNEDIQPLTDIKKDVEEDLNRIILKCLSRDLDKRYQSTTELSEDLKLYKESLHIIAGDKRIKKSYNKKTIEVTFNRTFKKLILVVQSKSFLLASLLILIVVVIILQRNSNNPGSSLPTIRAVIYPPEWNVFNLTKGGQVEISPDGNYLVFSGVDSLGKVTLWVQSISSLSARPLSGTDEGVFPFWSKDNKYIGFFASNKIKRVGINGGYPVDICDAPYRGGASWSKDGTIILSADLNGIYKVSGNFKAPELLIKPAKDFNPMWPFFLPDGNQFLYTSSINDTTDVFIGSLDNSVNKLLTRLNGATNVEYSKGYIFYKQKTSLVAQKFDADKLELSGSTFKVADLLVGLLARQYFSVSDVGDIVYENKAAGKKVVMFDGNGKIISTFKNISPLFLGRFSPDGTKIAYEELDPGTRNLDIWIYDVTFGSKTRLTFNPANDVSPVWSPDGSKIVFCSNRNGIDQLFTKSVNGGGEEKLLFSPDSNDHNTFPAGWSKDGKYILINPNNSRRQFDVYLLPLDNTSNPIALQSTQFWEIGGAISPNSKWVVYQSDESGILELYVKSIDVKNQFKLQVSRNGGQAPVWSPDGKKLYFTNNSQISNQLLSAEIIEKGNSIAVGKIETVIDGSNYAWFDFYDITPDGKKFLFGIEGPQPVTLVKNWIGEMGKNN